MKKCDIILFVFFGLFLLLGSIFISRNWGYIIKMEREKIEYKKSLIFNPGDRVFLKEGASGIVNRECWFSFNNYVIRLQDGTITYARGEELRIGNSK